MQAAGLQGVSVAWKYDSLSEYQALSTWKASFPLFNIPALRGSNRHTQRQGKYDQRSLRACFAIVPPWVAAAAFLVRPLAWPVWRNLPHRQLRQRSENQLRLAHVVAQIGSAFGLDSDCTRRN